MKGISKARSSRPTPPLPKPGNFRAFYNFSFPRMGHLLKQVSPEGGAFAKQRYLSDLVVLASLFILNFL